MEPVAAGIGAVAEIVAGIGVGHGPVKQFVQHARHEQRDRRACCGQPELPPVG